MNCREFEKNWNEFLDAQSPGGSVLERTLEAHASACEPCRAVSARYQILRQAVTAWAPPPAPSAESLQRLDALRVPSRTWTTRARRLRRGRLVPMAMAAAMLAVVWVGWFAQRTGPGREGLAPGSNPVPSMVTHRALTGRPLGAALVEATEATIDLAREASAPATRIGREILELDMTEEQESIEKSVTIVNASTSASDLLQSVGARVNESVKPLSGTARHAFSFLLGPPPDAQPAPADSQGSL